MKRLTCLILALLICMGSLAFASCKKKDGEGEETLPPVDANQNENPDAQLSVPENLDFGDEFFTILSYKSNRPEFYDDTIKETDGDTINNALYTRDTKVQDYLNVSFIYNTTMGGNFDSRISDAEIVEKSMSAGDGAFDLIGAYSLVPPQLAMKDHLLDLNELQYIDFSKTWWPSFMVDVCTVNGVTYFTSGDISSNLLFEMQGVLVDFTKLAKIEVTKDEIVTLVKDGEWTIYKMFDIAAPASLDDGDGKWDNKDFYGIHINEKPLLDSFYFASGLRLLEEKDNQLVVSDDLEAGTTLDLYELVYENVYNADHPIAIAQDLMSSQQCVFNLGKVSTLGNMIKELGSETIGILPFPKYETTEDYRTLLGSPHRQYCIPADVKNRDRSAAVMETLAWASYSYATPAVYETVMKRQYSSDKNYSEMFEIMRSGATTDLGILYYTSFKKDPQSIFRNAIDKKVTGWISNYRNNYAVDLSGVIDEINAIYHK